LKKLLLNIITLGCILCFFNINKAVAQRFITRTYGYTCYNYFDSNAIDATNSNNTAGVYAPGFSPVPDLASPTSSIVISAAGSGLSINNSTTGRSLTTRFATAVSVASNFIPNATDASFRSLNSNDWEWSLLYRSGLTGTTYPSTAPTNAPISSTTLNAWRYWLSASTSTIVATTQGFFLTQDNDGYLRVYANNGTNLAGSTGILCASNAPLTNGATYTIKIQRNINGYWKMYLDLYSASIPDAKTLQTTRTNASDVKAVSLSYVTSVLEGVNKSGSDGLFRFDDMHMYTRYIKLDGVNDPSLGIVSTLYGGLTNVPIFGMKLQMRGNYELGSSNTSSLVLAITAGGGYPGGSLNPDQAGKLYKTTVTPFATGTGTLLNSYNLYSPGNVASGGFTDNEVASGNPDGSLSTPVYYFITVSTDASVTSGDSFTFGAITALEQIAYPGAIVTVPITGTNGSSSASSSTSKATFGTVYDWKGGTTDFFGGHLWSTAANWTPASVPGSNDIVRIGVTAYTTTKIPQINATTTVGSVIIGSNGGNAVTLNLNNDITTFGTTFNVNNGLTVNASSKLQIVGGSSGFFPATMNIAGVSSIATTGYISSVSYTSVVNTGSLYLLSNATSSASIGPLTGSTITNSGSTAFTYVQRYLSAVRAYRLLSSPVYTNTASGADYFNFNYLKSSAFISGTGGATNGFDIATKGNPTLYLHREDATASSATYNAGNFKGIEKITAGSNSTTVNGSTAFTNGIPVGNGYMFFFVGDNVTNYTTKGIASVTPEAVTLTAPGTINQGDVQVNLWFKSAGVYTLSYVNTTTPYNLVGNPYPATIDWNLNSNKVGSVGSSSIKFSSTTSIDPKIFEYDPSTGNYSYYDSSIGASGANDGGRASRYIGSGQAFFIKTKIASATLTFTEAAKVVASQPTNLLMSAPVKDKLLSGIPVSTNDEPGIIQLRVGSDSTHLDNIGVFFQDGWTAKYNADEDGVDLDGLAATVFLSSYSSDSVRIALNKLPRITADKTIVPLFMSANTGGLFTFKKLNIANIPSYYTVWLKDNFRKDSLDITHNSTYSFNVDKSVPASFGRNRFQLMILKTPVNYHLLDFAAKKETSGIKVTWKVDNEGDYTGFEVEKKDATGKFVSVNALQSNGGGDYAYIDYAATTGVNAYRLKQNDINNNISYSDVITVNLGTPGSQGIFTVYPNPAVEQVKIDMSTIPALLYTLNIYNSTGTLIIQKTISGTNYTQDISALKPGVYIVELNDSTGRSKGKKKFVKTK
jgi:hypothetical protein